MAGHSTRKRRSRKAGERPSKPYDEFPLYAHPSGYWAKKIGRQFYYFGRWGSKRGSTMERVEGDGWQDALKVYQARIDDIQAGLVKPGKVTLESVPDGLTVKRLCDTFYTAKMRSVEAGEVSRGQVRQYDIVAKLIVAQFGRNRLVTSLKPADFGKLRAKMADRWGPVRLGNAVTMTRSIFRFGWENELIDKPVRFGSEFTRPSQGVLRKHKAEGGKKIFTRDEIVSLLDADEGKPLHAMILLGINCGLGNADVASLRKDHLDLEKGILDFPRPKTGIERRCSLWPETVKSLRTAIAARAKPKDPEHGDLVFLTRVGTPLISDTGKTSVDNLAAKFSRRLTKLEINGRRRLGFYSLRHTFRTVADTARDPVAIDLVMGHADSGMASHYRHGIDDERLQRVAETVREWLFGEGGAK